MTNTELIQAIRNEIERLEEEARKVRVSKEKSLNEMIGADGKVNLCRDILSFLSTLESEKPMKQGLDKEIDEISIHVPCSEFTHESEFIDLLDWLKEQFTYFYELGLNERNAK